MICQDFAHCTCGDRDEHIAAAAFDRAKVAEALAKADAVLAA